MADARWANKQTNQEAAAHDKEDTFRKSRGVSNKEVSVNKEVSEQVVILYQ